MATRDNDSQNAREWFGGEQPPVLPGQMDLWGQIDLWGTAGAEPDSPPSELDDGMGHLGQKRQRRRRGKGKPEPQPERPASLQRPPARPMTVAEVVARRLEAKDGEDRHNPQDA